MSVGIKNLKKFLISPSLLSKPKLGQELYLYLAASPEAVSFVLVQLNNKKFKIHILHKSSTVQYINKVF